MPNPARAAHPSIATPSAALLAQLAVTPKSAPMLALADGQWNHGERLGPSPIDHGGWFDNDAGTSLLDADVHIDPNNVWTAFTWNDPLYTTSPFPVQRLVGWLRPAGVSLPLVHPLYGSVPQGYVDQAAFEMFRPTTGPAPGQKILIIVRAWQTKGYPADRFGKRYSWFAMYPGFFSPDGLERDEEPNGVFTQNTDPGKVVRPPLNLLVSWASLSNPTYWPVLVYPVVPVPRRQTTLNEQRYMQLIQATKRLLQRSAPENPLGTSIGLTQAQIDARVVVCFVGGSNGGLAGSFAALRYPHLVHGAYAEVINPSYQRFYGEADLTNAVARLSGEGLRSSDVGTRDFVDWSQYVWSQGIEMHDLSYLRQFVSQQAWRPVCFSVGDEDPTSTGTDWAAVLSGGAWQDSVLQQVSSSNGGLYTIRMAGMIAESSCHTDYVAPETNAYTAQPGVYDTEELIAHDLFGDAVTSHDAIPVAAIPVPALTHVVRNTGQELRGLDDPQEWALGREGDGPLPQAQPSDPLLRDDTFAYNVAPGTAGTSPGGRESMLISDHAVFVGSADGFVSKFSADGTKQSLRRLAISQRLGHEAFGMTLVTTNGVDSLVVGTRRHLHRLDPSSLACTQRVMLPWEVAQPHHLAWADVLPGHTGKEVIFASMHGGLVFCDEHSLVPFFEWSEPGIIDFVVQGTAILLLSARGVVAKVTFNASNVATLEAVSQTIPAHLRTFGANREPPCQGDPIDLELMSIPGGGGLSTFALTLWSGDEEGTGVRMHSVDDLAVRPRPGTASSYLSTVDLTAQQIVPPVGPWIDIATCRQATTGDNVAGDHCLVLQGDDVLRLFDESGHQLGAKQLTKTAQPNAVYSFGGAAQVLCVGELVDNPGAQYPQEVVVATKTGLMWLHVDDLLSPGTALPATGNAQGQWAGGYWLDTEAALGLGAYTHVQPRTNESMACTWAMARRPSASGLDGDLHVLDQRGNYWKIDYFGNTRLYRAGGPAGVRSWDHVGPVTNGFGGPSRLSLIGGSDPAIQTDPWSAIVGGEAVFENAPSHPYHQNNWSRRKYLKFTFDAFLVARYAGSVVSTPAGRQAWMWSADGITTIGGTEEWGNLVEGLRFGSSGAIDGIWASTNDPVGGAAPTATTADRCRYRRLRTYVTATTTQSQQAAKALLLTGGDPNTPATAVVLGCPGGRVRVLHVLHGDWRVNDIDDNQQSALWSSVDLGLGGSALAARANATGGVDIWFGTLSDPTVRPAAYSNPLGAGALVEPELAVGSVHRLTWQPGQRGLDLKLSKP